MLFPSHFSSKHIKICLSEQAGLYKAKSHFNGIPLFYTTLAKVNYISIYSYLRVSLGGEMVLIKAGSSFRGFTSSLGGRQGDVEIPKGSNPYYEAVT